MAAKTNLPETISINLKFEIDRDWVEEFIADGDDVTLQMMLDALRDAALETLNDDMYNMVQTADVFDENGEQIA